ncbi:MAG: hypothetical protein JST65_05645 [Acidobacteria bacterium]|nr:hypothetical protein [Acidobacteriota bacterium]
MRFVERSAPLSSGDFLFDAQAAQRTAAVPLLWADPQTGDVLEPWPAAAVQVSKE